MHVSYLTAFSQAPELTWLVVDVISTCLTDQCSIWDINSFSFDYAFSSPFTTISFIVSSIFLENYFLRVNLRVTWLWKLEMENYESVLYVLQQSGF